MFPSNPTKRILSNLSVFLAGFIVALILCEIILRMLPGILYYRPFEILAVYDENIGHMVFKKGARIKMRMPYGDLVAISYNNTSIEKEPHNVVFNVDSCGFRNDSNYHGQKYVLVGDSFIFGAADSQEDILSSQLKNKYNIDVYNVSFTGDIFHYVKFIKEFEKRAKSDFKVLLFIYEGNDFNDAPPDNFGRKNKLQFIRDTFTYRFLKIRYHLLRGRYQALKTQAPGRVKVIKINGHKVGFLDSRIGTAEDSEYKGSEGFESALSVISPKVAHIFFIPEKYRVYYSFIEGSHSGYLPNTHWEYLASLCKKLNLKATNLTEPLIRESEELMKKDIMTWWKDDTHWNKYGIAVAAKIVAETLKTETQNIQY